MKNLYTVLGRTAHKTHGSKRSLGSSFGKVSLLLIITIIFFTSSSLKAQAPGNNCASAVALTLPAVGATITTGAQTTCGRVNDWGAGFSSVNTLYGGGEDGIYSINVPAGGGNYTFTLANSGATYKILSIHSACAPTAANTLGGFTTGTGRGGTVTLTLTAGVKYIVIDTWPTPNCGAFTLSITQNVAFTGCTSSVSFGSGNAPTAAAPNTTLTTCAYAGEYSTINSVAAATNYISTATGGASNYITIRLGSTTGALIAQGNSPLSWTSTTAGTYVQIVNTNSACGTDASCHTQIVSVPCTPSGNPATYGTNAWIGYVYDAATPGAFTTYKGFVNEATTFDRTHTTIAAGATASHCSQNQDLFTIRYRNTANLAAGYYTFSVGGDDGVRFSIDGGATWLINNWVDQGYTVSSNPTPVYLSGNVNMVFEYYENTGGSRSSFSYIFTPACSGTPTPGNTIASVASVFSGGTSVLSLQNATAPATYQWQSSSSSTGPWSNIGGATAATYTATVTANTWYQCVVTCTSSSTSAASTPVQVTLITPPVNDVCANATDLPCGTSALAGTTVNAVSETAPLGYSSPYGVWYSFVGDGQPATISSTAVFDHEMTIMTGSSCGSYAIVSSQDNAVSNGTETYTFNTTVGTQYYVYLANYSTTSTITGTFTISRSCVPPTPPVNDACANATDLPCGTSSLAGTTVNAVSETAPLAYSSPYGVWYSFIGDGQSTTISSVAVFDHEMTIMTGSSCGSYAIVSSQDNAVSNGTETYTFNTTVGTQYYVYLAHYSTTSTTTGTFTISRTCSAPAWTDAWVSMNTGSSNWCAGETRTISVTVTNTGASTWTDATPDINIGVKWNADADYFIRTDAGGLAPGATQTYNLTVTAPLTTGSNNLTFDVVNEWNFWFADNTNGGGPGNVVYTSPSITIIGAPTMNAGADQSVCQASSITLADAGTGSTSLSWNNGISNGVAFSAPSSTTTYTVTGTNAAGCTATDQVVVTIKPLPIVNAGADQTVCQGVIANLTGTVTGGSCIMSLTTSGGSFATEKWVNITTAANGGGTVVWAQGNGTIGNASGLLTNQSIDLSSYLGQTLYLNTYDAYDDGWDGSVYNLSYNGTTVINNGGTSPSDGTDADALASWEAVAAEMETSEAFSVPALTYAWTSSPAGFNSTALTTTASPVVTTTYTLSSTYAGCTGTDAVTVTLPTAGSALAQDNENATCIVNQFGWVHFYHSSGRLIASINSQGQNLGAVTATSYVEGAPVSVDACTSSNPIYTTSVMGRHWVITPTNQPTSAVLVRLPYENTEFSDLTSAASTNANSNDDLLTPSDLGLSKYSNGTNANVNDVATDNCGVGATTFHTQTGNGVATSYSSVNSSYADFSIPGFSEFWLHGSAQSSPLPVELVNFQANCAGEGKVNVTWATASEHNSANFTVEKSRDGMNWTVMASLTGAGNSTQMINYSTVDNNAAAGVNYYRLTQTDFDGASETFNIASANCGDNSPLTTVKVYPNPSAGDFYIDFNSEEITGASVITITDARGMEVYKMNVTVEKGSNVFHIENMEVAPGIYYIQVSNGTATSNIVKHSLR